MKNYYEILEIDENASLEVIKAAYRALSRKYHPDISQNSVSGDMMCEINEAYEILSDLGRKREYDIRLKEYKKTIDEEHRNKSGAYQYASSRYTKPNQPNETEQKTNNKSEKQREKYPFLNKIKNSVINTIKDMEKQYYETYEQAMQMDDLELVIRFKRSTGIRRGGDMKALEEREFIEKDADGKYKPTYKMKRYL